MIIVILKEKQSKVISKIKYILEKNLISIESIRGDSRYLVCFYLESIINKSTLESIMNIKGVSFVRLIKSLYSYKLKDNYPLFKTIKEMVSIAKSNKESLPQVIVDYESKRMLYKALEEKKLVFGRPLSLAVARAIACGEVNASMGKVVAAPTAGAVGVIPAVILTAAEELGSEEQDIIDALLVAAGIGVIIAYKAPISGAMGGCQSEVGVASAMAAAAIVQLAGGNSEQVPQAMALALKNILGLVCDVVKNILGLVCDVVAGTVEVPCIKRNVIGVANAFAVADMALAGIRSIIPPDEVIVALRNIQTLMPMELRDTTLGGLGITETAKRLKKEWFEKLKAKK
jgi:L-serine dehydratase